MGNGKLHAYRAHAVRVIIPIIYLSSVICHLKGKKVKSMIEERRYSKRELARLYWPKTQNIKSAMKNLRQDIKGCPELVEALAHTHWNINRHSYSAEQVRLIVKFLCEP